MISVAKKNFTTAHYFLIKHRNKCCFAILCNCCPPKKRRICLEVSMKYNQPEMVGVTSNNEVMAENEKGRKNEAKGN